MLCIIQEQFSVTNCFCQFGQHTYLSSQGMNETNCCRCAMMNVKIVQPEKRCWQHTNVCPCPDVSMPFNLGCSSLKLSL